METGYPASAHAPDGRAKRLLCVRPRPDAHREEGRLRQRRRLDSARGQERRDRLEQRLVHQVEGRAGGGARGDAERVDGRARDGAEERLVGDRVEDLEETRALPLRAARRAAFRGTRRAAHGPVRPAHADGDAYRKVQRRIGPRPSDQRQLQRGPFEVAMGKKAFCGYSPSVRLTAGERHQADSYPR